MCDQPNLFNRSLLSTTKKTVQRWQVNTETIENNHTACPNQTLHHKFSSVATFARKAAIMNTLRHYPSAWRTGGRHTITTND